MNSTKKIAIVLIVLAVIFAAVSISINMSSGNSIQGNDVYVESPGEGSGQVVVGVMPNPDNGVVEG